jgi:predicted Ser/Thr protein kinase
MSSEPSVSRPSAAGVEDTSPGPTLSPGAWTPSAPEALPARFGRYQFLRLLGTGGMGSVYLAHDPQLDRLVAVKVPSLPTGPAAARDDLAARFLREARAAAGLRHPNLCPVYDCGEIDGILYLTMAYIDGRPLSSLVRPGEPLSQRQVVDLVAQIALGLQEAHEQGIIHRDLKPANVMINRKGQPVVTDFGLARRAGGRDEARLTQPGILVGTPAYMSPEQVAGSDPIGPASDLYSLGVILYELLTGRLPFDGPLATLLPRVLHEEPIPPSRWRPDIDPALERLCLQALAKTPAGRPASMAAFAGALAAFPGAAVAGSTKVVGPRGGRSRLREKRRGGHVWLIGGGAALLLLALLETGFTGLTGSAITMRGWLDRDGDGARQWIELRRSWRPPPAGATPGQLFPPAVGEHRLREHDRQADCPELNLHHPGWRALYAGPGEVEVFAYRVSDLEREAILRRVEDALRLRRTGYRAVKGGPERPFLGYAAGGRGPRAYGIFWGDDGWLFHVRSQKQEPGAFLRDYLATIAEDAR